MSMRTIEEYLRMPYRMEIVANPDKGGYVVSFPDLHGCITSGATAEDAVRNAKDAKRAWFTAAPEDGCEIPEPDAAPSYSGQFKLRIPKSLHKKRAERSRAEGISMNRYCLYLLSVKNAQDYPGAR